MTVPSGKLICPPTGFVILHFEVQWVYTVYRSLSRIMFPVPTIACSGSIHRFHRYSCVRYIKGTSLLSKGTMCIWEPLHSIQSDHGLFSLCKRSLDTIVAYGKKVKAVCVYSLCLHICAISPFWVPYWNCFSRIVPFLPWVFGQIGQSKQCGPRSDATECVHCLTFIEQFLDIFIGSKMVLFKF